MTLVSDMRGQSSGATIQMWMWYSLSNQRFNNLEKVGT